MAEGIPGHPTERLAIDSADHRRFTRLQFVCAPPGPPELLTLAEGSVVDWVSNLNSVNEEEGELADGLGPVDDILKRRGHPGYS